MILSCIFKNAYRNAFAVADGWIVYDRMVEQLIDHLNVLWESYVIGRLEFTRFPQHLHNHSKLKVEKLKEI